MPVIYKPLKFECIGNKIVCNGVDFELDTDDYLSDYSYSYEKWIKRLHPDIIWEFEMDDDYQGDWVAFGIKSSKYYYISGSFGSCSGCDWLQSLGTDEEWVEYLNYMSTLIEFENKNELLTYLTNEQINSWNARELIEKLIGKNL
jgi:hypothetical protein